MTTLERENELRGIAVMNLAPTLVVAEALLSGVSVPASELDERWVKALRLHGDVVLDQTLALRVAARGSAEEGDPVSRLREDRVVSASSMASNFLLRLNQPKEKEVFYGNPWGIDDIEFVPGGFYPLGGRTGLGKSNLALDLFHYLCDQNVSSVYITNEMTEMELTSRLVCHFGGFKGARELRKPSLLNASQIWQAQLAAEAIDKWPCSIIFDETADHKAVSQYVADGGFQFLIFDHLHLMEASVSGDHSALQAEIKGLKGVALEHNIPVVAISQLKRPNPMFPHAAPGLHDFAGSQAIENAASIAMILHEPSHSRYQLSTVKNRDGELTSVPLTFSRKLLRFTKSLIEEGVGNEW